MGIGPSDGGWAAPSRTHYAGAGLTLADLQSKKNGNGRSKVNPSGLCHSCGKKADCANNSNYCLTCWRKREFGGNYPVVFGSEF